MAAGKRWSKQELFIALNLYHKLRFGQMHARQPVIVDLAKRMGRSSNSLAMKLVNLASLDPTLKLRGVKGLPGASQLDRTVWEEFHENPAEAVAVSEEELRKVLEAGDHDVVEIDPKVGIRVKRAPAITEAFQTVKQRRGQDYFREMVLNNFGGRCGVTGLDIRELLIASHILPWSKHPEQRLNVRNGLALSRLLDAAFDCGLIAFDENLNLLLSPQLVRRLADNAVQHHFAPFAGIPLSLPDDAQLPDETFLKSHRKRFGFRV